MSFFDSLRRVFGFDSNYDSDDETNADDLPSAIVVPQKASGEETETEEEPAMRDETPQLPPKPEVEAAMRDRIFAGVVTVFNSALPDFLQRSVDPERQRRLLLESLDKSLAEYLDSLVDTATRYAEARLQNAAIQARRESERLRTDMEQLEAQRASLREQRLSAERRRRALSERVKDLESQLASADAEREQYELEKKSLLNKIKLADVQPGIIEELQQEIDRLRQGAPAGEAVVDTAAVDALNAELSQARARIEELTGSLQTANEGIERQREQVQMSGQLYSDLQNELVSEREAHKKTSDELAEAQALLESVVEMQQQMEQVAELIQKRDERIHRLKANNKKLKEELAELRREFDRMREASHGGGLFDLAPDEGPEVFVSEEEAAGLAQIEDDFECPDWFVQPGPGEGILRGSDEPFGYTPPTRKPTPPENDAQLSLFE